MLSSSETLALKTCSCSHCNQWPCSDWLNGARHNNLIRNLATVMKECTKAFWIFCRKQGKEPAVLKTKIVEKTGRMALKLLLNILYNIIAFQLLSTLPVPWEENMKHAEMQSPAEQSVPSTFLFCCEVIKTLFKTLCSFTDTRMDQIQGFFSCQSSCVARGAFSPALAFYENNEVFIQEILTLRGSQSQQFRCFICFENFLHSWMVCIMNSEAASTLQDAGTWI